MMTPLGFHQDRTPSISGVASVPWLYWKYNEGSQIFQGKTAVFCTER